ncbi:phage terminase small subunit P27 family [Lactobacillus gigeriorum]|uniref:Orf152 gp n=1 Tax=Lactobacillus gigeriorum DSM 23908 = CRBIP 24.85 TaxID=1423751 RepID=I7LFV1_9LACO|nr:phage terminase small subunit P27 family [Lactobacillus gigeriorum]KRN11999.1 hypothetical protein FC38_GL000402 [Lactobacillus gigeriorum DSM 23908 = CRBIP 24.85]CCI86988.1 Orf152 gp [Lactobacillus gigeriorum DSM 23908 = CRBIP 24.85]
MANVDLSKPKVPTQAPKWLGTYGKYLWPKIANYLNKNPKILRADEYLVQQYCSAYDLYRTAYDDIQENGIQQAIYKTSVNPVNGDIVNKDFMGFRKNPAYQVLSDSLNKMASIGHELGLSPKARSELSELSEPTDNKKSISDSMREFFNAKS